MWWQLWILMLETNQSFFFFKARIQCRFEEEIAQPFFPLFSVQWIQNNWAWCLRFVKMICIARRCAADQGQRGREGTAAALLKSWAAAAKMCNCASSPETKVYLCSCSLEWHSLYSFIDSWMNILSLHLASLKRIYLQCLSTKSQTAYYNVHFYLMALGIYLIPMNTR